MTIDVTDAESRLNWRPVYKVSPADNFRDFARRLGIEECPMNKTQVQVCPQRESFPKAK